MSTDPFSILVSTGAILENGHYALKSKRHSRKYVNKDAVYLHPDKISILCRQMAMNFHKAGGKADIVVGPAVGGVILSQWVAYHLSSIAGREVLSVYADKIEGSDGFLFKRGYDELIRNRDILGVEDVMTTGGSMKRTNEAIGRSGGNLVGIAALCNRGHVTRVDLGADHVPYFSSLVDLEIETWTKAECPICAEGKIPVDPNIGHGREYLAEIGQA